MNKFAIVAVAALAAGTLGMAAIAQDNSVGGDFEQFDGNKDGVISFDEARGSFATLSQVLFDQADSNGDGSLDEGEFVGLKGLTAGETNNNASTSEVSSSEASSSEASSSEVSSSEASSSEASSSEASSSETSSSETSSSSAPG